ncbi:hypothetical protein BKA69DRAFT_408720 [Paraphysoderma sedebokerense]|nr:hypothetical protein BKA69DRAFT_408720 [Paraphysoderma sedebokerense]
MKEDIRDSKERGMYVGNERMEIEWKKRKSRLEEQYESKILELKKAYETELNRLRKLLYDDSRTHSVGSGVGSTSRRSKYYN